MLVEINTSFLKKHNLSPNQYVALICILNEVVDDTIQTEDFIFLNENGWIEKEADSEEFSITPYTKKILKIGTDPFDEFYDLYPSIVTRPDGSSDYLKGEPHKCRVFYNKLLKSSSSTHDFIMECLKYEIHKKATSGKMCWFKRMPKWLYGHDWLISAELMKKDMSYKKDDNAIGYGQEIL